MASFSPGGSNTGGAAYVRVYIVGNADSAIAAMSRTAAAAKVTESSLSKAGTKMKSVGSGMISTGYALTKASIPIALIGGYAIKSALSFEKAMTLVRVQAGASAKEMAYLNREVVKLSGKQSHGFGPNELAEALYPIRSDGFKAAEAMGVLNAATAGARVGQANLALTANALGGAIKTYGGGAKAAASDMNILNETVGFGKFKLEELDQALTSGFLVQAQRSGIGLKEIGTALDSLARKSIPPQVEATRLQKTLIQFQSTSGIAQKALATIGISQYQLSENMKKHGLISTLEEIRSHLKRFGSGPEAEAIEDAIVGKAFGRSKGSANVGALLQAIPEMRKIEAEKKHYTTLQQALSVVEQKSYYKIQIAIAELKKGLVALGQTLIPIVIPMFQKAVKLVQELAIWFSKLPKPIKDVGVYLGIAAVLGGPLLILFGNLFKAGGAVIGMLGKLVPAEAAAAAASSGTGFAGMAAGLSALAAEALPIIALAAAVAGIAYAIDKFGGIHPHPKKEHKAIRNLVKEGRNLHGPAGYHAGGLRPGVSGGDYGALGAYGPLLGLSGGTMAAGPELPGKQSIYEKANEIHKLDKASIELHTYVELDRKIVAESNAKYLRDHPAGKAAVWHAEAVTQTANIKQARVK